VLNPNPIPNPVFDVYIDLKEYSTLLLISR
jgi:hypothetical protein